MFLKSNHFFFIAIFLAFFLTGVSSLSAKDRSARQEVDTNQDGKIDEVWITNEKGRTIRLENDTNADGQIDRVQYYTGREVLEWVEQDTDYDGYMETRDFFVSGKRVRNERSVPGGAVERIIYFDKKEYPFKIEKDSDGNTVFDTFWDYEKGLPKLLTRDTLGIDRINFWQTYKEGKPVKRRVDTNDDRHIDEEVFFDKEGLLSKSSHDLDFDQKMDEFRTYVEGIIILQQRDMNHDNFFERVTRFEEGKPTEQERDSNHDKIYDIQSRYKDGILSYQEKDSNFDNKKDIFSDFDDQGALCKTRRDTRYSGKIDLVRYFISGTPDREEYDEDQDGFMETTTSYKEGLRWLQTRDKNKDGKPDERIYFNRKEEKKKVEQDTDLNTRFDVWQFYREGRLIRVEKD